jgi:hypothetical protein
MPTESWDWTGLWFPENDLDDMEVIGNRLFRAAVPVESDAEFKAYIFAAGATHSCGIRSVDNLLRRHGDLWTRRFEQKQSSGKKNIALLRREVMRQVMARCEAISKLNLRKAATEGTITGANAQIRLESTFRAASQLLALGFAFESEAVTRLGFEQIAWIYAIRNMLTPDEIESTSATGSVTDLKHVFPGAGRIYNRLSNLAHVSPKTHPRYLGASEGNTIIRIRMPSAVRESMLLLVILLDAFLAVGEICLSSAGLRCENIDRETGHVRTKRIARTLVTDFSEVLRHDSGESFASWWKVVP